MKRNVSQVRTRNASAGSLRHYHRSGGQNRRTWDEWVYGDGRRPVSAGKWLKILVVLLAVLALGGIIAGLYIELQ